MEHSPHVRGTRRPRWGGGAGPGGILTLVGALALFVPSAARAAPTREACADAYEGAQRAMKASRLLSAREAITVCLDDACPGFLRADCAKWLTDVERLTPSVVILAGGEVGAGVRVTVDGVLWAHPLDGRAHEMDPGYHTIVVALPGEPARTRRVLIKEGEKAQRVDLEAPREHVRDAAPPSNNRNASALSPGAIALFAVGAASAVGFGVFAAVGRSEQSDLDGCRPYCDAADVDRARRHYLAADVFLGVSVVALATATILTLTRTGRAPVAMLSQVSF